MERSRAKRRTMCLLAEFQDVAKGEAERKRVRGDCSLGKEAVVTHPTQSGCLRDR